MESIFKFVPMLALLLGAAALLLVAAPGPGYRFGVMQLATVFEMLKYGAFAGLGAMGLAIIAMLMRFAGVSMSWTQIIVAAVLGAAAFYFVFSFRQEASAVPPIHDITTDTVNPPAFVAVAALRGEGDHPVSYDGADPEPGDTGRTISEAQLAAYPDLLPSYFNYPPNMIHSFAEEEVEAQGWDMVASNEDAGIIEATDQTFWYGFSDDIVIRIARGDDDRVRVDVRSKSRVGISDVGANAARIEAYLSGLEQRVQTYSDNSSD